MLTELYPSTTWSLSGEWVWSNVRTAGPATCVIMTFLGSSFCTTQQQDVNAGCRRGASGDVTSTPGGCGLEVNVAVSVQKPNRGKPRPRWPKPNWKWKWSNRPNPNNCPSSSFRLSCVHMFQWMWVHSLSSLLVNWHLSEWQFIIIIFSVAWLDLLRLKLCCPVYHVSC